VSLVLVLLFVGDGLSKPTDGSGAAPAAAADTGADTGGDPAHASVLRGVPAVLTVAVFLFGMGAIQLFLHVQKKKKMEEDIMPFKNEELSSDWLKTLKKAQTPRKGSGIGAMLGRRGSKIQASLNIRDKKNKVKKYALYDDMLEKYKQTLRAQKQHTLRKQGLLEATKNSGDKGEESGEDSKKDRRTRLQEMAMRHRGQDDGQDREQQQGKLPHWQATLSSVESDSDKKKLSIRGQNSFKDSMERSVEGSDVTMTTEGTATSDEDTTPLIKHPTVIPKVSVTSPPRIGHKKGASITIEGPSEEVFNAQAQAKGKLQYGSSTDDDNAPLLPRGRTVSEDTNKTTESDILEEEDIKEALRKISETEDAKVSGSGSRPQSMVVTIQNGNKRGGSRPISLVVPQEGETGKETGREKEEKKRRSWYQGVFGKENDPPPEAKSVEDLIEEQVVKTIISRMPHLSAPSSVKSSKEDIIAAAEKEVTKSKESLELLKIEGGVEARGGKRMDEEDPPQPQVVVKRRGSGDPKPKKQARARSWFGVPRKYQQVQQDASADDMPLKKSSKRSRPTSMLLQSKLRKENRSDSIIIGKSVDDVQEDAVTELFAKLMDLPPPVSTSRGSLSGKNVPKLEEAAAMKPDMSKKEKRKSLKRSERDVERMLKEVERRMIMSVQRQDNLADNEIFALEKLLDDVSKYCTDYSETWEDTQNRRQLSFSEANEELERSSSRAPSRSGSAMSGEEGDDAKDKVKSVYDTNLDTKPTKKKK